MGLLCSTLRWLLPVSTFDITVPECGNCFALGPPWKKVMAAKTLLPYLCGEPQILEELYEQARGERGCSAPSGQHLFSAALHAAGRTVGGHNLAMLLLQCTQHDAAWGDDDEWNSISGTVLQFLRDQGMARETEKVRRTLPRGHTRQLLEVLLQRLEGDRNAEAPSRHWFIEIVGEWLTWAYDRFLGCSPGLLAVNNRCFCLVCDGKTPLAKPVLCPQCKDIGYCSEACMELDRIRHGYWCFA
mmetsp:Transcript_4608/g.11146  ORF Transcript_4608/g.11146 Transcript_4608/m.11146 type:complete len:243 (+) Transcript_4608:59-787(+)